MILIELIPTPSNSIIAVNIPFGIIKPIGNIPKKDIAITPWYAMFRYEIIGFEKNDMMSV